MQTIQHTFHTAIYKSLRGIAFSALNKAGLVEGILYEKTGFILVPRSNGSAVGIYYTQVDHTGLDDYKAIRGERMSFYTYTLENAGFTVKKVSSLVNGGDPCLEASLR